MANKKIENEASSELLNKRLGLLATADMDYLSGRILMLNGLLITSFQKHAEAFEKLLKLFVLLEAKINRNEALDGKFIKKEYEHNLPRLFDFLRTTLKTTKNIEFDSCWDDFIKKLYDAYSKRYPEGWKVHELSYDLDFIDAAYFFLRKGIVSNFPLEQHTEATQFGGSRMPPHTEELNKLISANNCRTPIENLLFNNRVDLKKEIENFLK